MGKAQRNASHKHSTSVDSTEKKTGPLEKTKGAELTKNPRGSQKSRVTNSPTLIRSSMARVVATPRLITMDR